MKVTKVISLCEKTYAIAQSMDNFSAWVRGQLLATDEKEIELAKKADEHFKKTGTWPEWYS
ncbi:unnamed protein product [marine sediment metagenome]|uniref:Uncharacterized protein n=1 Tax=marine sediment metagenome TaxID=412755 RepID=X0ZRD2_9ZZZZ